MLRRSLLMLFGLSLLFLTGCETTTEVVSNIDEKEANVIIVLLESKGISATKVKAASGPGAGDSIAKYTIMVPESNTIDAIAYLNQSGFPKKKAPSLLDLFSSSGLVTSNKEETIRYQAGLTEEINGMILMIDGVIDSKVQLSFPPQDATPGVANQEKESITAAVYVKHQGVIDDPNTHLVNKIKRLVAGSIAGLDVNDVTVVSDRSRFTDITVNDMGESLSGSPSDYVSIWSIVMSKGSTGKFRLLFFFLTTLMIIFALLLAWIVWKFYPLIKKRKMKELFNAKPITGEVNTENPNETV
ncbi:MAG: hypothetical protein SP1CHLAM54_13090 [Chlamydiia bacterium]|nr:hypothetical protein [Chlamydiia bacterium]MCH9616205.1 hypothetical protein [Chlamydiia bacterium]MCH9629809.1 hypothetical protein [Chlamydiia bacterium]